MKRSLYTGGQGWQRGGEGTGAGRGYCRRGGGGHKQLVYHEDAAVCSFDLFNT